MIEPELFKFNPQLAKHSYLKKQWDKHLNSLDKSELIHSITVVLPDISFLPDDVENIFSENSQYYHVQNVTLGTIIDSVFIQSFVKNGNIQAVSLNTRIGVDDCMSISKNNLLQMFLLKNSYQNICLPVHGSRITLNLIELDVNSKKYHRIKDCFKCCDIKFNILIDWEPFNDEICPSSIASYFNEKGLIVNECFPRSKVVRRYNTTIPYSTDVTLLDTWLSYFSLDIKIDNKSMCLLPDGKLTKSNSRNVSQIIQINWSGFFTKSKIKIFIEILKKFMENSGNTLWFSMHLEPYSNVPYNCNHQTIVLNSDKTLFYSDCICAKNH
ncbi:ribonuclease P protein subunit p40-like isoform X1 [Daktulosphaira vitifoliae]|uniref:ribonuclease P protein subunit p40-like isoform X1 n=1 Tax=Daktulosphaira vitifoliae TaxID=58002 RepID=UPI0021A97AE6|nr:ribonuclease P protein subunit p40-like isoform X1 [Daktulosphaira vitifoliae]